MQDLAGIQISKDKAFVFCIIIHMGKINNAVVGDLKHACRGIMQKAGTALPTGHR
jgi:hypothetical protein